MSSTPKRGGVSVCQKRGTVANDTDGYKPIGRPAEDIRFNY